VIGGRMLMIDGLGRVAAKAALHLLNGQSPQTVEAHLRRTGPPTFDWRELQRWGVKESQLPPGSIVRYQELGVWQRFKWIIITCASALIGQALLIGALLVNRAKRRRAEQSLQEHVADLKSARAALSQLSGRLMEAHEQERSRLARELHDDVGQRISFLAMDVAQLRERLPSDVADAQGQATALQEAVVGLGRDVQEISHRLHSSKIDLLGLSAAASSFCKELASRHDLKVEYVDENVPSSLPEGVAISLFRVLQEALSNAVKHSGARRYQVMLRGVDGELKLEVIDDGRGFDVAAAVNGQGLGLISMQERLNLVNGNVLIESKFGAGTTVRASVPLPPVAVTGAQSTLPSADRAVSSTTA
jgi:signal transduction histidine kinase